MRIFKYPTKINMNSNQETQDMMWSKITVQLQNSKISNAMMIFKIVLQTALSIPVLATNEELLKSHVHAAIQKLLEGADQQQGTADDLITPETAEKIRTFLSDENLEGLVHIVTAALAGDLVTAGAAATETASRCCLACFFPKAKTL